MPRRHNGGFIDLPSYWGIGTDAQRGRDGDTARAASRKYNDHRHPAAITTSPADLSAWSTELNAPSTTNGVVGGYLVDDNTPLRVPGDIADLSGDLFAYTQESDVKCVTSGFTRTFDVGSETFTHDHVDVFQPINPAPNVSLREVTLPVGSANFLVGESAVFNSVHATNAEIEAIGVAFASIKILIPFPVAVVTAVPPVISATLTFDIFLADAQGLVPPMSVPDHTDNKVFESVTLMVANASLGNTKLGYESQEVVSLGEADKGIVRVHASTDFSSWFTDTLANIATASGLTEAQLNDTLTDWLRVGVQLDIMSLGVRHRATF
jgi:hypothetical protein